MLDVSVSQTINAPPEKVAAILFDSVRDAEWIGGAQKAEIVTTDRPYGVGYRVRRTGAFLGRRFAGRPRSLSTSRRG